MNFQYDSHNKVIRKMVICSKQKFSRGRVLVYAKPRRLCSLDGKSEMSRELMQYMITHNDQM